MMHSGRIDTSERHRRILRVLQSADYPPSAGQIVGAIVKEMIDRGMSADRAIDEGPQAVSTTIGEMRSEDNREAGYIVSTATYWKIAKTREQLGPRLNGDKSITFYVERSLHPWHDGRARYWLRAAPGWVPRWTISDAGLLVPFHTGRSVARADPVPTRMPSATAPVTESDLPAGPRLCITCGKEISADGPPFCKDNDERCKNAFFGKG